LVCVRLFERIAVIDTVEQLPAALPTIVGQESARRKYPLSKDPSPKRNRFLTNADRDFRLCPLEL
jgi:hypothetical protein